MAKPEKLLDDPNFFNDWGNGGWKIGDKGVGEGSTGGDWKVVNWEGEGKSLFEESLLRHQNFNLHTSIPSYGFQLSVTRDPPFGYNDTSSISLVCLCNCLFYLIMTIYVNF